MSQASPDLDNYFSVYCVLFYRCRTKRKDNQNLAARAFSEISPEGIETFRKRFRAFGKSDVIAEALHLEPLPHNPNEDAKTLRQYFYDSLAARGLRQAVLDPENGLWIPVNSEENVRHFFDFNSDESFIEDADEYRNEPDEKLVIGGLSPSPTKIPKVRRLCRFNSHNPEFIFLSL